jgi:hypothetical protein
VPTPVPPTAQPQELDAHLVANPVSASSVGQVWAAQCAYLLGRTLPTVTSIAPHQVSATGTALPITLFWWPSPGCRLAALSVDLHGEWYVNVTGRVVTGRKRATLDAIVPSGAGVVAASHLFDGAQELLQRDPLQAARATYGCAIHLGDWGDVTDDVQAITVTIDDVGGDTHQGIAALTLSEIPVATLRPETGELGLLLPTIDARNDLHDGDTGIGSGIAETIGAEQDAARRSRFHWQLATYEHTSYAWTRASATTGALDWVGSCGTTVDPVFRLRVPALYGAATSATFALRVRYASTEDGTFRVVRSPVGAGSSNFDEVIVATGGGFDTFETTLTLSPTGTDQEIDLSFHASTLDASPVYISAIAIIANEGL